MSCRPSIHTCDKAELLQLTEALWLGGDKMNLRRSLIFAAGAVNNERLRKELGSMELSTFYEGMRAADPGFTNPYWPDQK